MARSECISAKVAEVVLTSGSFGGFHSGGFGSGGFGGGGFGGFGGGGFGHL